MINMTDDFAGVWRIDNMEDFDDDYINEEVKAHITIDGHSGSFQFGFVQGRIDGEIVRSGGKERFEFTFEATDEMDSVSGSGWAEMKSRNEIIGKFKFHCGDSYPFHAKRAIARKRSSPARCARG